MRRLDELASRAARWCADHRDRLATADLEMPAALHDRAADNWRPLLTIADLAGGEWPQKARAAATALAADAELDEDSARVQLLADIHDLFAANGNTPIWTTELCASLWPLEHRPWGEWKNGRAISPRQLAHLLSAFRITPTQVWAIGEDKKGRNCRGYKPEQFRDAFLRYLPFSSASPLEPKESAAFSDSQSARGDEALADENRSKPSVSAGSSVLADKKGEPGAQEGSRPGAVYDNLLDDAPTAPSFPSYEAACEDLPAFGATVRAARERAGLSPAELGARAKLNGRGDGIGSPWVQKVEEGRMKTLNEDLYTAVVAALADLGTRPNGLGH